jgi:Hemopexin
MFQPDDSIIFEDDERLKPNKCNTNYDAVLLIHGETFIFKGQYMWRPDSDDSTKKIREMWPDLPEKLTHVDAVYENDDGNVEFFIDRDIYVFRGITLIKQSSLTEIGIDQHVRKVTAVFRWHHNGKTYIFAGNHYWRMEGERVDRQYPRLIRGTWKDVYDIDTAFGDDTQLYFFKGKDFFNFDSKAMRLDRMKPHKSAQLFMRCPKEDRKVLFTNRFGSEEDVEKFKDVIDDAPIIEIPIDEDNFEKSLSSVSTSKPKADPNSSSSFHLHIALFLASLAVSRVLPFSIVLF